MHPTIKKSLLASSVALAIAAPSAQAALVQDVFGPYTWSTDSANFTMLTPDGYTIGRYGGGNDVVMFWDGNAYNASSDYTGPGGAANVTASSNASLAGPGWTAHDIQMFAPGSYSFDTALGGGNPEAGMLNVTVDVGQLGMHMLWNWGGNQNVDAFVVFDQNSIFGSGIGRSTQNFTTASFGTVANYCDGGATASAPGSNIKNCLFDGKPFGSAGQPAGNQIWMLASADGNDDDVMGIPMTAGGPFQFLNFNFNANLYPTPKPAAEIPIPAAVWLFGSGLLGLVGIARRKKKA